jgi:hypothetical protein
LSATKFDHPSQKISASAKVSNQQVEWKLLLLLHFLAASVLLRSNNPVLEGVEQLLARLNGWGDSNVFFQ